MTIKELKEKIKLMSREFQISKEIDAYFKKNETTIHKAKKSILEEIVNTVEPLYDKRIKALKELAELEVKLEEEAKAVPDTEDGQGLKELRESAEDDIKRWNDHVGPLEKVQWVINRAKHYQLKTGKPYQEIINIWVSKMTYWYANYFQEANQPLIIGDDIFMFANKEEAKESFKGLGFRCPLCGEVSNSQNECDSGKIVNNKPCDWKSYGLFGTLGKGVTIILKDTISIIEIFKPIAYEGESSD